MSIKKISIIKAMLRNAAKKMFPKKDPLKVKYTDKNFMDAWEKVDKKLRKQGLVK